MALNPFVILKFKYFLSSTWEIEYSLSMFLPFMELSSVVATICVCYRAYACCFVIIELAYEYLPACFLELSLTKLLMVDVTSFIDFTVFFYCSVHCVSLRKPNKKHFVILYLYSPSKTLPDA